MKIAVPRRLLYVITDLEVGGVPLHLARLAGAMVSAGTRVRVVSLRPAGAVADLLRAAGVEVTSCEAVGAWDWRVFARLAEAIASFAPDCVHALLFHANLAARIAGLLSGFPRRRLICEIQTVEIERRWHLRVERFTHGLCRWVVGNSESVLDHLHLQGGVPRSRLRLIAGGVDLAAIDASEPVARDRWVGPDDAPLLLWVGRLDPIKGLDTLLDAAHRLSRTHRFHLLIAGSGPEQARLEQLRAGDALQDCTTLLGTRRDVPALLRTVDLFVFPSRTEGMPNALLEAMGAGLPVVTTDAPGCRDLVRDGETGRIVPVDDAARLAAVIAELLDDAAQRRRLAGAARAFVARRYTATACHDRYRALYAETLDAD